MGVIYSYSGDFRVGCETGVDCTDVGTEDAEIGRTNGANIAFGC